MEIDESQIKTILLQEKAEEKRLEMIWFGGIPTIHPLKLRSTSHPVETENSFSENKTTRKNILK